MPYIKITKFSQKCACRVCPDQGIITYSVEDLKKTGAISRDDRMGVFHDVAGLDNGEDVIIATSIGLFHVNMSGR